MVLKASGGCNSEVTTPSGYGDDEDGGVAGGVASCDLDAGRGPGEQNGICRFGTGAVGLRGVGLDGDGGVLVLSL